MNECKRHKWHFSSSRGVDPMEIGFRCENCKTEYLRKATKKEQKILERNHFYLGSPKRKDDIHYVIHDFQRKFGKWNLTGYEFMVAVEKWAKKFPNDVQIIGCDDDSFMSSNLVLIEHKSEKAFMGTTVVYIPQNNGPVQQFFLYPGHLENFLDVLTIIKKKTTIMKRIERKNEILKSKNIKTGLVHPPVNPNDPIFVTEALLTA